MWTLWVHRLSAVCSCMSAAERASEMNPPSRLASVCKACGALDTCVRSADAHSHVLALLLPSEPRRPYALYWAAACPPRTPHSQVNERIIPARAHHKFNLAEARYRRRRHGYQPCLAVPHPIVHRECTVCTGPKIHTVIGTYACRQSHPGSVPAQSRQQWRVPATSALPTPRDRNFSERRLDFLQRATVAKNGELNGFHWVHTHGQRPIGFHVDIREGSGWEAVGDPALLVAVEGSCDGLDVAGLALATDACRATGARSERERG